MPGAVKHQSKQEAALCGVNARGQRAITNRFNYGIIFLHIKPVLKPHPQTTPTFACNPYIAD